MIDDERMRPCNLEAERAVLGSILADQRAIGEIAGMLTPASFYSQQHASIFAAMQSLYAEGKPIDLPILGEELNRRGELLKVGGAPALLSLAEDTLTSANLMHYAKIVADKETLRRIIYAANDCVREAIEGADSEYVLSKVESKIFAISHDRKRSDVVDMRQALSAAFDRIGSRNSKDGKSAAGIQSRFYSLNEMTNGWHPSQLIILAARPAVGKTALAMNFVEDAAIDQGKNVLVFSLEMSSDELIDRMLCSVAKVSASDYRMGRLSSEKMQKILDAGERLSPTNIWYIDTPGMNMLQIGSVARYHAIKHGIDLIVVDYLQLIVPEDGKASRTEQIGSITRRLKILAKELRVPIIVMSQLNREVEKRASNRPQLSDLRESGSIEQDADVVMLLHREGEKTTLIVGKQRNGPTGDVNIIYSPVWTRFDGPSPGYAAITSATQF